MLGGRDFAELSGVASKVFDDFLDKERLDWYHFLSPQSFQRLERIERSAA